LYTHHILIIFFFFQYEDLELLIPFKDDNFPLIHVMEEWFFSDEK